jgi:REP element-mobilizing transposase RayT
LPKVIRRWDDVELVDYAIASDHVHLILRIGITEKLCSVIGSIKQFTASKLRAAFPFLRKVYWKEPVVWARGYFVGSVGTDEKKILAYVRGNQC